MIYTDRKYLSILRLTEDRDYVTYDELIHVLTEQLSNAVYIERNGVLCGLVTSGHIARRHDEKIRHVPFSKKFTSVSPGEYWRVRQIFRDKENINVLPVVSEDGHLLGDYVRWNDLTGLDYVKLLCKDPSILQCLKEQIQDVVFIEPSVRGGAIKEEMFLWWRQKLESERVHLKVIQPREIKDYLNVAKNFLFVNEEERSGALALIQLYHQEAYRHRLYFTITEYLHHMRQLASAHLNISILRKLQNQGVFVLVFDIIENNNQFLAVLDERIKKRNEEYGIYLGCPFPEELKESFFDELYCEVYKAQEFPLPMSCHTHLGIPYLSDLETEFVHIQNGERLTVNQPVEYDRCIYMYGPCVVTGLLVSDQNTISSFLQSEINQGGFFCKVVNHSFPGNNVLSAARLQSETFRQGDIIVLDHLGSLVEDFPILNLTDALEKHDAPADWFFDIIRHCNHKANQVFAHAIYKELTSVLQQPPIRRIPVKLDFDYIDCCYLSYYFSNFDHASYGTVGSIVMNCNPFTLGHRFLIEEALKTVDYLIIFVVEEDESIFPFQERFAMVCQGTSDLGRVMVVPSGPYILSKTTFPEYFKKISDEDLQKNTESDITLFAEKIAPALGITHRFVGEEREDKVTNEYNEAMKRILPRYGIHVVEIPRKANGQSVISASRVRQCLSMNDMEELDKLIPASTKHILFFEAK